MPIIYPTNGHFDEWQGQWLLVCLQECLVSHISTEPAHLGILSYLKKEPILNLNMRLGEGSGAAVAAMILKSAIEIHNGMATFSEAGVHKKN